MKKLYFLCTGNSCRSQIAEGYAKKYFPGNEFEVRSAGTQPDQLNLLAVKVMQEDGVDISQQYAKAIDPAYLKDITLVVTLCGDARDHCPTLPTGAQHLHWALPDPAKAQGSAAKCLVVFRQVRDEIKRRILKLKAEMTK